MGGGIEGVYRVGGGIEGVCVWREVYRVGRCGGRSIGWGGVEGGL